MHVFPQNLNEINVSSVQFSMKQEAHIIFLCNVQKKKTTNLKGTSCSPLCKTLVYKTNIKHGKMSLYPRSLKGEGVYCFTSVRPSFRLSKIFFVTLFSVTVDGRNMILGHKRHISIPYCGQRFWTHQIPTSCLPTQLVFIHIEHICKFFVTFFSATIDSRDLIFGHKLHIGTPYRGKRFWTHQIPSSCLPILLIFIHI